MAEDYDSTVATFRDNGIYAIGGPNWEQDIGKICSVYGYDTDICFDYSMFEYEIASSVKGLQYWYQNGMVDQFNEWQPNWLSGDHSSAPVDVSKIADVPMSFIVGATDKVCPADVAKSYIGKMKTQTSMIEVSG